MIFLDSSYLIALMLKQDRNYKKASDLKTTIFNERIIINNTVLSEVLNSFNKYNSLNLEHNVNNMFKFDIDYLTEDDYKKALTYYRYYNTAINFSDCTILVTMNKYNTDKIVSFDSDFNKIKGIINISF
ncbi:MAG: type II toxin-antitoxin system VapC family toxin [Methanobrevibacter woesei]|uniref:type II toxin-antitoxin system VapC family toxin n=1 Tax=Methanobrevibacter woesei TaxID=190976 RepID=UPI0023F075ED|nr:type II toxin-antitoxin system VapC family toxin [Methanobrevibacter woesei]MCI7291879.1 type II toxin-antitoxin system VapC family toxin [Methanobrevibacter woesei]